MKCIIIMVILLTLITGCSSETQTKNTVGTKDGDNVHETNTIDNPTADEVLTKHKQTDIFLMNGIVYVNAEEIDWVIDLDLTIDEEVMEIIRRSDNGKDFIEGTASILPIGTKIYKPLEKGDIYIAIVDGKEVRYFGLREG